jgi:hypothetical protein
MAEVHDYNAYLRYRDLSGKIHIHKFWVMSYTQPFQLSGEEAQSKRFRHFYAKNYMPGDMTVVGRTPHQEGYNALAEFIRAHHMVLMNDPGANNKNKKDFIRLMMLAIPNEGVQFSGIIKSFSAGAKRFNVAPEYTFDMMVIHNHNSLSFIPSYAIRRAWIGNLVPSDTRNLFRNSQAADPTGPGPKPHRGTRTPQ